MEILNKTYLIAFLSSFLIAFLLIPLIKKLAGVFDIVDKPSDPRKIHKTPIPLLGGMSIFIASSAVMFVFYYFNLANFSQIPGRSLWAVFTSGLLIMIGGLLDDKYNLKPKWQILWPVMAAVTVIISGIKIDYITNPGGDPLNAIIYLSPIFGVVIIFFWLMGMMYTTKFLDGLDGLAGSISLIAAIIIFLLGLNWDVNMSATGIWALSLSGAILAFLLFNWNPASVFLGEGGSIWLGFILAVLSIISGSKIATTLLVVGIPALDVLWVIIRRIMKHQSPFSHADRKHLHYQLLGLGFSHRGAVWFLCLIALSFGSLSIFADSFGKVVSLAVLIILMAVLVVVISIKLKQKGKYDILD